MSGPYRDGDTPICPRCNEALLLGTGSSVCPRDCGEWVDEAALAGLPLAELGSLRGAEQGARRHAKCARCRRDMGAREWDNAEVEVCTSHGVWIDTRYRAAFHGLVAETLERERALQKMVDLLAASDPTSRRELARRLLAMERRLDRLERR